MKVEHVGIDTLHEDPRNARSHGNRNLEAIKASLLEFGQQTPIVVAEDGLVIAGNGRLRAAKALGWTEIAIVRSDLEGARRAAYSVADNRTAELADWDNQALASILLELADDPDPMGNLLEVTGFEDAEIEAILREAASESEPEAAGLGDGAAPPRPKRPVSELGDLWTFGAHRVLCGDSTDGAEVSRLLSSVPSAPFLMVTDPPYGVEYRPEARQDIKGSEDAARSLGHLEGDSNADWSSAFRHFTGSVAYVWHAPGPLQAVVLASLQSVGFDVRRSIVWVKPYAVLSRSHYSYAHEPCWYAVRGDARWSGPDNESSVWKMTQPKDPYGRSGEDKTPHPTQKPLEAMARPIRNHGKRGDVVFDPFLGSGTTLMAAEASGRICVGLELDPGHVDVIVRRWDSRNPDEPARLEGSGRTFAELAAERGVELEES